MAIGDILWKGGECRGIGNGRRDVAGVKAALAAGANINALDSDGDSALALACIESRAAVSKSFYARLAACLTPVALVEWVRLGREKVVARLLTAGMSPDVSDGYGASPLTVAAQTNRLDLVVLLLAVGADVTLRSHINETPLPQAAYYGYLDIIAALLAAGADPNQWDEWRGTALHAAARNRHVATLACLHQARGLLELDPAGDSLLMRAARFNHTDALVWLIEAGAQLDIRNAALETALSLAVEKRNYRNVWHLLHAGAKPDPRRKDASTPLMLAAEAGALELVQLLLQFGAAPNASNVDGVTPLLAARRAGHMTLVTLLTDIT